MVVLLGYGVALPAFVAAWIDWLIEYSNKCRQLD